MASRGRGSPHELPQLPLEERHADDGVAAVDRAAAVEVEEAGPGLLGQDLERGEVPGLGRDLDPGLGAPGDDQDGVLAAAHAADGPVPGEVVQDAVGEGGGGDVVEGGEAGDRAVAAVDRGDV